VTTESTYHDPSRGGNINQRDENNAYSGCSFDFELFTPTNPKILDAIRCGMSGAWKKLVGTPRNFKVQVASFLHEPETKERLDLSALYIPSCDSFQFALDTIMNIRLHGMNEADTVLLIAAHEATHAAQFARGESLTPYDNDLNSDDNPHEREAWVIAASVFKDRRLGNNFYSIQIGKHKIFF